VDAPEHHPLANENFFGDFGLLDRDGVGSQGWTEGVVMEVAILYGDCVDWLKYTGEEDLVRLLEVDELRG